VHLPDLKGRKEIFELYLNKIKYDRSKLILDNNNNNRHNKNDNSAYSKMLPILVKKKS
jgi:hypothetical protein